MRNVVLTAQFRKDFKLIQKRNYDMELLRTVVDILADGSTLPEQYRDHALSGGDYPNCRECHILPDWLLVYQISHDDVILYLTRTGTHSDIF